MNDKNEVLITYLRNNKENRTTLKNYKLFHTNHHITSMDIIHSFTFTIIGYWCYW